jgi:hypothetical protein
MNYRVNRPSIVSIGDVFLAIREGSNKENCFVCVVCYNGWAETRLRPCGHILACWNCAPNIKRCSVCHQLIKCYDNGDSEFNGNSVIGDAHRLGGREEGSRNTTRLITLSQDSNIILCSLCKIKEAEVWLLPCRTHGACWYCSCKARKCLTCNVNLTGLAVRVDPRLRSCPNNY